MNSYCQTNFYVLHIIFYFLRQKNIINTNLRYATTSINMKSCCYTLKRKNQDYLYSQRDSIIKYRIYQYVVFYIYNINS